MSHTLNHTLVTTLYKRYLLGIYKYIDIPLKWGIAISKCLGFREILLSPPSLRCLFVSKNTEGLHHTPHSIKFGLLL